MEADRRNGFTLIELVAVIAILALVAAMVVISVRKPLRVATLEDSVSQLRLLDQQVRTLSRRFDRRQELTFHLNTGRVHIAETDGGQSDRERVLGGTVDRVMMGRRVHDYGDVSIRYDAAGRTPTFAVRVSVSDDVRRWLLFAGITGQVTEHEYESEVRTILDFLSQRKPSAAQ